LVACALAVLSGKTPSTGAVLLSVGFAVSFVTDSLSMVLLRAGLPNLWPSYIGTPIQFALLIHVVGPGPYPRALAAFLVLLAVVTISRGQFSTPETVVHSMNGAWVALVAWRSPRVIDYRDPIILYCAGTIPFLLILGMHEPAPGLWMRAWAAYQGVRVMALAFMAVLLLRAARPRLEVLSGRVDVGTGGRGDPAGGLSGTAGGVGHPPDGSVRLRIVDARAR
jgi:hypothetical protein